jgi:hypothetical protein
MTERQANFAGAIRNCPQNAFSKESGIEIDNNLLENAICPSALIFRLWKKVGLTTMIGIHASALIH